MKGYHKVRLSFLFDPISNVIMIANQDVCEVGSRGLLNETKHNEARGEMQSRKEVYIFVGSLEQRKSRQVVINVCNILIRPSKGLARKRDLMAGEIRTNDPKVKIQVHADVYRVRVCKVMRSRHCP
jgi:hypothetical protein